VLRRKMGRMAEVISKSMQTTTCPRIKVEQRQPSVMKVRFLRKALWNSEIKCSFGNSRLKALPSEIKSASE
jgi:hypothetical protein